ncbi:MAG: HIT domain-containing protein [Phycisphaerae bacterium]
MPADPACVFCKIIAGQIPALRVLDDEAVVAFLDVGPLAPGHTLLVPREHHARLADLPAAAAAAVGAHLPRLAGAILKATGATGLNLLQNSGRVAGQVVEHVHFHLIPRRENDGLGFRWNAGAYTAGQADAVAAAIRAALPPA